MAQPPASKSATEGRLASGTISGEGVSWQLSWKLVAGVVWLCFTVALAAWWIVFSLRQAQRISEDSGVSVETAHEITRHNFMLMSEGATLVVLLLVGGSALLYYIATEMRRSQRLREFFATFTHELKTSLASVRLQAESLEEDLEDPNQSRLVKRLVRETVRLELQLENSLLFASPDDSSRFLLEPVNLRELFATMSIHWPDLNIEVDGDETVEADRRAVESIFKNLIQNAVIHGESNHITVHISRTSAYATIRFEDSGRGFQGDRTRLGQMFGRHASTSGSGLGLYLAARLARTMRGELRFCDSTEGFCVEIVLPIQPTIQPPSGV